MTKKPARVCVIEAPCKINLHLDIGERGPDGFHRLESLFVPLALADTLRFERCPGKDGDTRLSVVREDRGGVPGGPPENPAGESIPPEDNLISKAITLFRARTGFDAGLAVRLDKRIPLGAGLGGGSSDAASTLLAMNSLAGTELSPRELTDMAAALGSDVPFFLSGGAAFVSGRGEKVEPIRTPRGFGVVLVKPPFSSGTAAAYRLLDQAREQEAERHGGKIPKEALIQALQNPPSTWPFYNDFLPVFLEHQQGTHAGIYGSILTILRKCGASFTGLSGSGSCCFGIYDTIDAAEQVTKVSAQGNFVISTFFLAQRPRPVLQY